MSADGLWIIDVVLQDILADGKIDLSISFF